jgi:hypothetical protein
MDVPVPHRVMKVMVGAGGCPSSGSSPGSFLRWDGIRERQVVSGKEIEELCGG